LLCCASVCRSGTDGDRGLVGGSRERIDAARGADSRPGFCSRSRSRQRICFRSRPSSLSCHPCRSGVSSQALAIGWSRRPEACASAAVESHESTTQSSRRSLRDRTEILLDRPLCAVDGESPATLWPVRRYRTSRAGDCVLDCSAVPEAAYRSGP